MEQSESSQIPRLRTASTGWIRSEQMTTDLEKSSGARRSEEHHITSVLLAFNWRRLLHIQSDGVHTVGNPDRKAFSLVWLAVTVDQPIISIYMALESMCLNDALKFSRVACKYAH